MESRSIRAAPLCEARVCGALEEQYGRDKPGRGTQRPDSVRPIRRVRLLDRIHDGLADLLVLTGGAAAAADRADDLAVRKQRQPAFDGNRAGAQGQKHGRRASDGILELLGRTTELGGRFGLANRYVAGAELGVLHASEID